MNTIRMKRLPWIPEELKYLVIDTEGVLFLSAPTKMIFDTADAFFQYLDDAVEGDIQIDLWKMAYDFQGDPLWNKITRIVWED